MDNVLPPIEVYPDGQEPPQVDTNPSLSAPAQDPDTGVSLKGPGPAPVTLPEDVATDRAKKYNEAVGKQLNMSPAEIKEAIQSSKDFDLRKKAADSLNEVNYYQNIQSAIDYASKLNRPLTEDELNKFTHPFDVDPNTVMEKEYGKKYIGSIQDAIDSVPGTPVQKAQEEIPEQAQQVMDTGSELVARMELINRFKQNINTQVSKQGYASRAWDAVKMMWQPYNEYQLRGNTPGVSSVSGIDLDSNMQNQADHIFSLPFDQFASTTKEVAERLQEHNPLLALQFLDYMSGMSTSEKVMNKIFSYMVPMDLAGIGKAGVGVARKISLYNRTNKAVKDYVQAAARVGTDVKGRAEAAGDLNTAAETKAGELILADANGQSNPINIATDDTLLTNLNMDKQNLEKDLGNLTREQVTRIQDQYDAAGRSILQKIVDAVRINRIPMATAVQNAVSVIKDSIKDYYGGIRNNILDISNPLYEAKSNTFWHEVTVGNDGGKLFSNPDTALNYTKLHNLGDAKIVEGYGPVTAPEIERMQAQKASLESNITDWEQTVIRRKNESLDKKRTIQERTKAKEQAEGISQQIEIAKKQVDDLSLKLKSQSTFDRVKQLESEIDQFKIKNKELNDSIRKNAIKGDVADHIRASIEFAKEQIKAKAQEINAIKKGTAEVRGPVTVEQHGVGYKIVIRTPLRETDSVVRDLLVKDAITKELHPEAISTSSQTGWKALFNGAIGKFRGAEDTLALNDSVNRKIATYTQSLFKEWANQEAAYIRQITSGVIRTDPVTGEDISLLRATGRAVVDKITGKVRQRKDEFIRTLNYARDAKDDQGRPGYFFQTPGELDNFYQRTFGRSPDFAEHEAYFAFVRMVEGDRILREIAEFRNRARLGVEQFSIAARGPDGKPIKSDFFDGVRMNHLPGGDDVMMIMSRKMGEEKVINLGGAAIGPKQLQEIKEKIKRGELTVLRVYAPEYTPLRGFSDVAGNEHVRYILTDRFDAKPLEFNHVERRGGGHFEYDYDHYIKQAKMYHQWEHSTKGRYRSVYTGDTTFMPVLNQAMGQDISRKLNVVRELLKKGDRAGAEAYTQAHLPIEFDELDKMFKPGRDANGKVTPPRLDINEPFQVVPKSKSILDLDKNLEERHGGKNVFKDGTKSGSDNRQFQVAWNTERESFGVRHFDDVGSAGNPLYKYAPEAKMIDPITTMNKALNRIVNTVFMDDYKIYAVEHWLREAEPYLKASIGEIRTSPFYHFEASTDKAAFKAGTDWETIQNLLSNRYKIKQFVGIPSSFDTAIQRAKELLVNAAYKTFGPEANRGIFTKAVTIVPVKLLARVHDPITFMRSMVFHEKLGFFNPAQWLVQAQTYAAIWAISPKHSATGTFAAMLHQWARINASESILKALDEKATKMNFFGSKWKPGEFREAFETLRKTGFEKVAGEYANLNTALKTDFIGNSFKSFLHAGTFFFQEGEKATRLGAWYTAFREYREANPLKTLTKDDIGKILQRADLLTMNMSRASSSALHSGVFSLTSQFITYQLRQAELFLGSRLGATTQERMMARFRMVAMYSALYGLPFSVGITGLPFANSIRQEAIQRGYTVGQNWFSTMIDQGIPAFIAALVTGKGDYQAGANPNIGGRYGAPGFTQFQDALKSDHAWYTMLAGASGTALLNTLGSLSPFWKATTSFLEPSNQDKTFKLKAADFVDLLKEISTVNQTWKLITAINTGKWMSKNENYVGDISAWGAAVYALTGMNPQQQDDAYLKADIKREEIAYQKSALKKFIKEYHRYLDAVRNGDPENAKQFAARANSILIGAGYPQDKIAQAMRIAVRDYNSQIDDEDFSFATKDTPQSRSDFMGIPTPFTTQSNIPQVRRDQLHDQLLLNQKRKVQ